MTSFIRLALIAGVTAVAMQLTGCASLSMTQPQATMANATKLRTAGAAPVAVGTFNISAAKAADEGGHSMRGANTLKAPGGSIARYLGESLKVELQSAGLLDPNSSTVISGTLTDTELNANIGTGTAKLAARFVVTRGGAVKYDQELAVNSQWESSFMAAVAVPLAANNYEGLYRALVSKLLDDAAFRAAIAK